MTSHLLQQQATKFLRKVPDIQPGYTVRVHEKIQEGNKERIQIFEGLVISVHNGHVPTDASFTVRKVVSGIGVEKIFPIHAPSIDKIEVKKVARARRAKLFFLRGRAGKSARLDERFTTEDEFKVVQDEPKAAEPAKEEPAAEAAAPAETSQKEEAQAA